MRDAAKEIGISDVALGKACRRCNIPKPRQGHWNMPEKSREAKPELGPEPAEAYYRHVHLHVLESSVREAVAAKESLAPTREVGDIRVPKTLHGALPLVVRTRGCLQKEERDGRAVWDKGALDIRVSKKAADRALRLMDALIRKSVALGDAWKVDEKNTTVTCEGTPLRVRLSERFTKRDLPKPTAKPGRPEPYWWPRFEWVGTGEFTFQVDEHTPTPVRKVWKDTASSPLEDRLADLLETLPKIAHAVQAKEEQWRRDREEFERRAREAQLRADEIETQRQLRNRLASKVRAWERAQRIRAFCVALAASPLGDSDDAREWSQWAQAQADSLDPFCNEVTSWLSLNPPTISWVSQDERSKHGWWPAPSRSHPNDWI
jgi:hypothetical protein